MLDLDSLADKRAKTLNEKNDKWRNAVWSADFQKISKNMSDGEVEILLSNCKSFVKLEAAVHFLTTNNHIASPYAALIASAKNAGVGLSEWINSLPESGALS